MTAACSPSWSQHQRRHPCCGPCAVQLPFPALSPFPAPSPPSPCYAPPQSAATQGSGHTHTHTHTRAHARTHIYRHDMHQSVLVVRQSAGHAHGSGMHPRVLVVRQGCDRGCKTKGSHNQVDQAFTSCAEAALPLPTLRHATTTQFTMTACDQ